MGMNVLIVIVSVIAFGGMIFAWIVDHHNPDKDQHKGESKVNGK